MGLVDSPKVQAAPGKLVDLKPTVAPDAKTASQYYPANYWLALLEVPEKNQFPGTGSTGNGISPSVKTQGQWIHLIKTDSCESCHQLGNKYTRTIPAMFSNLDPSAAWLPPRAQSGQAGTAMVGGLGLNSAPSEPRRCLAIGPRESRKASCLRKLLRVRKASNAT